MTQINHQTANLSIYANEYKELCKISDSLVRSAHRNTSFKDKDNLNIKQADPNDTQTYANGWKNIYTSYDPGSQFKAAVFQKGDMVVISYVGTNAKSLKDLATDAVMTVKPPKQMEQAVLLYDDIFDKQPNAKIIVTGHSEGGSEATYVCHKKGGVPTFTYNPYMIGGLIPKDKRDEIGKHIINYRHRDDIVSKLGIDIGEQRIIVDNQPKFPPLINQFKQPIQNHRLENMGDCLTAVPLEQYKKFEPQYVDKLNDIAITQEDINDLSLEEFELYEPTIMRRYRLGQILTKVQANALAKMGKLIHVNSYVRNDGTVVKEHYRHAAEN